MLYNQFISKLRSDLIGKKVIYAGDNNVYTIVDVDYNGALLIDKPARFTETTAVSTYMVEIID